MAAMFGGLSGCATVELGQLSTTSSKYSDGFIETIAGTGSAAFQDGIGTFASFNNPQGICIDSAGNIYVADTGNHRIRKIYPNGQVSNYAGTGTVGSNNGFRTNAQFNTPFDVACDASGNVYVADSGNYKIRKIYINGYVSNFCGSGISGFLDGSPTTAQFKSPNGLVVATNGIVYVSDYNDQRIRKIMPNGYVSNFAGTGSAGFNDGTLGSAQFNNPQGLAFDVSGNIYVADQGNYRIRKITKDGQAFSIAGNGTSGTNNTLGAMSRFTSPVGVAVDNFGNVYVADGSTIRKLSKNGTDYYVSTLLGTIAVGFLDGNVSTAAVNTPNDLVIDSAGNLIIADTVNNRIRKITFK